MLTYARVELEAFVCSSELDAYARELIDAKVLCNCALMSIKFISVFLVLFK